MIFKRYCYRASCKNQLELGDSSSFYMASFRKFGYAADDLKINFP